MSAIAVFAYFFLPMGEQREQIVIPTLVGKRLAELETDERLLIESELVFSDTVPEGEIVSQSPYAGAIRKIEQGKRYPVRLTVSLGRECFAVPRLEGYSYSSAAAALRSLGARVRVVSVFDEILPKGIVLKSSPQVGEPINVGDQVTLFVSRKHRHGSVTVRDLTGLLAEQAYATLLSDGLFIGEIELTDEGDVPEGCVVSQSLTPGILVRYGSYIDLTVKASEKREEQHPFGRYITED